MGVTGLWRLIEPAGKPVPVETLENKVLAVDISIWLHQMVKGYQDAKGAPLPNAHLIGLFQRLCKLLYFRIKPVFVFDGGYPQLKKETIAKRQSNKLKYNSESQRIRKELALLLSKKTAISGLLGKQISSKKNHNAPTNDDIFKLPALPQQLEDSESESDDEQNSSGSTVDLHTVDVESDSFKNLPVKEKYELLIELKETRKMNSWGKLHELPKKSDNFSDFQMQRLLKRRKVQECLQETEKEMGDGGMSMVELESFLNEEGIDTKIESLPSRRIASNNTTRYLLINNVKQALSEAKKKKEIEQCGSTNTANERKTDLTDSKKDELEDDLEKAIKMSLECSNSADTSMDTSKSEESWSTFVTDSDNYSSDSEEVDDFEPPDMTSAKAYIKQYSDFTERAINQIVAKGNKNKGKAKQPNLNEILNDINKEKSVILDKVDLSSSDDERIEDGTDSKNNTQSPPVGELNTTEELKSQINAHNMDTTQASLVCIDNSEDEVITLNSSREESPALANQIYSPKSENRQESDSSDDDFEDVSDEDEVRKKTVVQLTLNVNDKPDDDIFADIFADKQSPDKNCSQLEQVVITAFQNDKVEDDDDELQKAIMMSLECVDTEPTITEVDETQKIIETVVHKKSLIYRPKKKQPQSPEKSTKHESSVTSVASKSQEKSNSIKLTNTPNIDEGIHTKNVQKNISTTEISTENARKSIPSVKPTEPITTERLNDMVEEIQAEEQNLAQEKGRLDRIGRNITEEMTKDAKELLQIFGIPYIVAPTEAEAQCAFLESVKLTDGTITDDSDIWLFGGQTVYKNFFNQRKHVLQFLGERIEKSFNLNREQFVLLALLVGSDYTTGVDGVGPVTALEILASFPFNKRKLSNETNKQSRYLGMITGLQEFKQWVRSGRRTDNTSLKKKLRNVEVTDDFPSVRVVQAYLEPNVEKNEDKFSWGEPDVTILRDYTKAKFGWSQHKFDEIINPVIKRLLERKSQKTVHDYFKRKLELSSLEDQMSKRVKAAVQKMGPEKVVTDTDVLETPKTGNKGKGKGKKRKTVDAEAGPSNTKQTKTDEDVLKNHGVKVVSDDKSGQSKSSIEIKIPKSDRYQEVIPQREKDKHSLLQNKLKAIELFRKTQIDQKKKKIRKKPIQPKVEAELSESSDSN